MLDSVLYFGRENCRHSIILKKFLKKKSKKFYFFENKKIRENFGKKIPKQKFSHIFCFRSFYILKKSLINKASIAAINFHPGPPEYRGPGGANYAIYDNSNFYGSTCHLINEKIDNGRILDVKKFKIKKKDNVQRVIKKTHDAMLSQAKYIVNMFFLDSKNLNKLIKKNKNIKWSKKIKKLKDLNNFYRININISKSELDKKIRATNTERFKPYIVINGHKFIYSNS